MDVHHDSFIAYQQRLSSHCSTNLRQKRCHLFAKLFHLQQFDIEGFDWDSSMEDCTVNVFALIFVCVFVLCQTDTNQNHLGRGKPQLRKVLMTFTCRQVCRDFFLTIYVGPREVLVCIDIPGQLLLACIKKQAERGKGNKLESSAPPPHFYCIPCLKFLALHCSRKDCEL